MDTKFFKVPFANTGDVATVPDATQPDGSVSYEKGYGPDYALDPGSDPAAILIERDKMNDIFNSITESLGALQKFNFPQWINSTDNGGSPFSYGNGACVVYTDLVVWQSIVASNTATPGTDVTKWIVFQSNLATTAALTTETNRALVAEALLAPKVSPALTGTPTAPTAAPGTNTSQLATTQFTTSAVTVEANRALAAEALLAPLASPALTGNPTAPTQAPGTNSTRIASTAYADAAVAVERTRALAAEALLAPLASPAFTGVPTVPTAAPGTNTTQAASTAFVTGALAGLAVGGRLLQVDVYPNSGAATWTRPANTNLILIEAVGGGASGGGVNLSGNVGMGAAGAAGSALIVSIASPGSSLSINVGTGGATAAGAGNNGTDTTISGVLNARGGSAGPVITPFASRRCSPIRGGAANNSASPATGTLLLQATGGSGTAGWGFTDSGAQGAMAGNGGDSIYGGGGRGATSGGSGLSNSPVNGDPGAAPGAGGGGAAGCDTGTATGGAGKDGQVTIWSFS